MVFKAGYRRLPKELLDIIWSYDNRYKLDFNKCLVNLLQKSNRVRCMDILIHEKHIYNIYVDHIHPRVFTHNPYRKIPQYGYIYQLYEYILYRRNLIKRSGLELCLDNLQCYNLKKQNQIN